MKPAQILEWYIEAGVDEAVGDAPVNRLAPPPPPPVQLQTPELMPKAAAPRIAPQAPSAAIAEARRIADGCNTLAELEAAVRAFDGCAIKKTATKTVFADGNPNAKVMVIGEAPGAQEDMQGIPFCGPSGALLDKVLGSIGLTRADSFYITNTLFWRPPGNRAPSPEELAMCEPFLEKHIALVAPKLLILSGGVSTGAVLKKNLAISRLRGKFYEYSNTYTKTPIAVAVTFHPSYLLRSPSQKRLAWHDMLLIRQWMADNGLI